MVDDKSHTQFLTISMPLSDFASAVTGLMIDVDMELFHEHLGKTREGKTELVPSVGYSASDEDIDAALAPFEVFGWKGCKDDMTNHHRNAGDHQRVSFTRHV